MNVSIKVLLIIGGYLLIALVVYLILYCKACKNYKTSSYTNLETYIEREEGWLSVISAAWPFYVIIGSIIIILEFIESKIRKHYGI